MAAMGITNSESWFDRLPEDIIHVIFRSLPVKTLGRCITVSKSFASLINSTTFIYSLPRTAGSPPFPIPSDSNSNDGSCIFVVCKKKRTWWTVSSGSTLKEYSCPTSAFGLNVAGGPKLRVVGSCKGLICLREFSNNRILLWNPLLNRSFILPKTGLDLPCSSHLTRIGLGFDSKDNDYKVLIIPYSIKPRSGGRTQRDCRDLQLYSLKSDSWQAVHSSLASLPTTDDVMAHPLVFASESLHYIEGSGFRSTVVAFDMGDRALRRISTPMDEKYAARRISISEYDGGSSIALMAKTGHLSWCDLYELWVMKKYGVEDSWVKLTLEDFVYLPRIPGFKESGSVWIRLPISKQYIKLRGTGLCEYKGSIVVRDEGWNCSIPTTEPLVCSIGWKEWRNDDPRFFASTEDSLALLDKRSTIEGSG